MEYLFGTRSGGWQDQDRERAAQLEEERKKSKKEKAKALQEAAKNQPQEPQNLPLPVLNPQVDIPTPPCEESSETSGDPEFSQSPQLSNTEVSVCSGYTYPYLPKITHPNKPIQKDAPYPKGHTLIGKDMIMQTSREYHAIKQVL